MTKTSTGKETGIKGKSSKPTGDELRDDDLQEVSAGLAANQVAVDTDPVCITKLSR